MANVDNNVTVNFTYKENGKTVTKQIKCEKGIMIDFSSDDKSYYKINNKGQIVNSEGKIVKSINGSKSEIATIFGLANIDGNNALTQSDIDAAKYEENNASRAINMSNNKFKTGEHTRNGERYGFNNSRTTGDGVLHGNLFKDNETKMSTSVSVTSTAERAKMAKNWENEHGFLYKLFNDNPYQDK